MTAAESEMPSLSIPVICVVGPTATGKSALAQALAERLGGEVVSADSMQVYRGMDIGTGKVLPAERTVPYHCLDIVEPGRPYSAALFQEDARAAIRDIDSRGGRAVLCGGTGLYVRAAIDAYDFPKGEQVANPVRERYELYAKEHGGQALWELLRERDPRSAEAVHPNNVRRVVRAVELLEEGTTYADQRENLAKLPQLLPAVFLGLAVDPALLAERINARVDAMFADGLVDEVRSLLGQGLRAGLTAPQAIGYKEVVAALDGLCSMDDAAEQIKLATRRYAKRQRTWFRKDQRIVWLDADTATTEELADEACALLDGACSPVRCARI